MRIVAEIHLGSSACVVKICDGNSARSIFVGLLDKRRNFLERPSPQALAADRDDHEELQRSALRLDQHGELQVWTEATRRVPPHHLARRK
ncbi:hypothetical protein [Mesorhizobium helmanticense]|uniref:hypothetical protein n=1 Tax=Mesorhizobium helmanticense TaxID=1776423 RepID=UPI0011B25A11|nr:hypothetical protein [Mesorhizobium helmanticense]